MGASCTSLQPSPNATQTEKNNYANWKKTGIAWSTDLESKFIYADPAAISGTNISLSGFPLPRVDDEDFVVWMRTAGLPTFRKLYRVINSLTLEAGSTVRIVVQNSYPVTTFSGTKSIVFTTSSWLGGKNAFLGWCYIAVGALCAALAIAFQIKQWVAPRSVTALRGCFSFCHFSSALSFSSFLLCRLLLSLPPRLHDRSLVVTTFYLRLPLSRICSLLLSDVWETCNTSTGRMPETSKWTPMTAHNYFSSFVTCVF